eukprot:TRINITY_DN7226_c0_g1_i1.p1 TRINITY_DN7226_c0_g1~~TRINITY_DN7226_c0_g1_i1.p1  ORF type:complete len:388 (+),score=144.53 TRINITY_DN7226_c0_g1_i1:143-1165(+)
MANFLTSYKTIYAKLKKRTFLKKESTKMTEGVEQLTQLINTMKRSGQHQYVAFCCLAVGRCEQVLRREVKEAAAYVDAGNTFFYVEVEERYDLRYAGFEENVVEAIHCYLYAIHLYTTNHRFALAASLYYEMASMLLLLQNYGEAALYFTHAARLHQCFSVMNETSCYNEAAVCHARLGEFDVARDILLVVSQKLSGVSVEMEGDLQDLRGARGQDSNATVEPGKLYKCHNMRVETTLSLVLLSILLRQFRDASKHTSELAALGYNFPPTGGLPSSHRPSLILSFPEMDIRILLEHFVTACQKGDEECLLELHEDLWTVFNPFQHHLLKCILREIQYEYT